ncbi:MAG: hypothetical protein ACO331_03305 [Prochlorothrix sp.]
MPTLNLSKLPITTIDLSPGSHLLINAVTWEQYEALATGTSTMLRNLRRQISTSNTP